MHMADQVEGDQVGQSGLSPARAHPGIEKVHTRPFGALQQRHRLLGHVSWLVSMGRVTMRKPPTPR